MRLASLVLLTLCPLALQAQESHARHQGHVWQVVPDVTSADLAASGWTILEAAGLPSLGGAPVGVTFWEHRVYGQASVMRCLAIMDASLNQVADVCSDPAHAEAP